MKTFAHHRTNKEAFSKEDERKSKKEKKETISNLGMGRNKEHDFWGQFCQPVVMIDPIIYVRIIILRPKNSDPKMTSRHVLLFFVRLSAAMSDPDLSNFLGPS